MAKTQLSFEPQFHRYVEHGEISGWCAAFPLFVPVTTYANEVVNEQQLIEAEGGTIMIIDFKAP